MTLGHKTIVGILICSWLIVVCSRANAATAGDYDGDGKADVAVFRPANGTWYIVPSSKPNSPVIQQWGTNGDILMQGDFDGDGIDDVAIFRPSNGTWYIIPSSHPGTVIIQAWGTNGDIPVPGYYDASGKTSIAVFRPSNGTWYIIPAGNPGSPIVQAWGTSGDIPVPAKYDASGKTSIAVFRPSNGTWYIIPAGNPGSPIIQAWGTSGDIPVPAKYDASGKTSIGVFRPSNGYWYIVPAGSPGSPIIKAWGTNGDIPVPADYDGDGIADITVWRPSNGVWYSLPSASPGVSTVTAWGAQGDVPIEQPVGSSLPATWTWMSGRELVPAFQNPVFTGWPGVYGTLGVAAPGNVPGSRGLAVSWTDSNGNLWLFGGEGQDSGGSIGNLNDLWEFNTSTKEWTWVGGSSTVVEEPDTVYGQPGVYGTLRVPAAGNIPGGRQGAAGLTDSSGNLWLFGGYGIDSTGAGGYLNDLWEFNPSTKEWTWMAGDSTVSTSPTGCASVGSCGRAGVYGTPGMPAAGNVPGSRESAVSWIDGGGNFWLFGGDGFDSIGESAILNDLWEFNPATGLWAWMGGSKLIGQAGVYGTLGVPAAGNVPGSRQSAMSWIDRGGNFWLFGGDGSDSTGSVGELNDVWEFSPSAKEWTWIGGGSTAKQSGVYGTLGAPAAGNVPGSRLSAVSWIDGSGNFWLFGGSGLDSTGTQGDLNDLWEFNPSAKTWIWAGGTSTVVCAVRCGQPGVYGTLDVPAAANIPGGRLRSSAWNDGTGNFWLFGGFGLDSIGNLGWLDDLWEYRP